MNTPFPNWHSQSADNVLTALKVDPACGLDAARLAQGQHKHGPNALPAPAHDSAWRRFARQFNNVLIHVLLAAALVTFALGHVSDALVILGVVVINAVIGFVQEGRAEAALAAIRDMLAPRVQVLRERQRHDVAANSLVPGDIVFLSAGERIAADLRLCAAHSLQIDESALTGESVPVDKSVAAVPADTPLAERSCMAWSGCLVTRGQGSGVVVATGSRSEIGRIGVLLGQLKPVETPLARQFASLGRQISLAVLALSVFAFGFGVWVRGYPAADMFMAAVGLAVAAIPEGLPAIMSITLAIGVQRMARRQVIIRHLPAVEALGAVSLICTDKTGTLTRNEMTVRQVLLPNATLQVSGSGYAPHGGFSLGGAPAEPPMLAQLADLGRAALLCNDASLHFRDGQWQLSGDPTEGALICLALKAGLDATQEHQTHPRLDVIPFDADVRWMASLHHDHHGRHLSYIKGAPEAVLPLCAQVDAERWQARLRACAQAGMRLLAVAGREVPGEAHELSVEGVRAGGFRLLGVLGLADPPRDEAADAIARCHAAGIQVKMITGDHADTARTIGHALGLDGTRVLTGRELDAIDDAELPARARECHVYARTSPEHKLRLVRALQSDASVVAMTGDGVNDAPALKCADVGVAMGERGTAAAREAAVMVLADDNFASIAAAVEEGRTVYDNLRKALVFILPTNLGEAAMLVVAIVLGLTLPITPLQILWVNMVTAVTLALALAFEKPEADLMRRPPRDSRAPMLTAFLLWRLVFVSALMVLTSFGLFLHELSAGADLAWARTVAVNALVAGEIAYLFNARHLDRSILNVEGLSGNPYALATSALLVLLQLAYTYLPFMQTLFDSRALDAAAWGRVLLAGLVVLVSVELEKHLLRPRPSRPR